MKIISDIPLWWIPIIAIIALSLSIFYYRKKGWLKEITNSLRIVLIGLRFLSLFFIAVLLLGILFESVVYKTEKPIIVTLLDNSASMLNYADSAKVRGHINSFQKGLEAQYGDQFELNFIDLNMSNWQDDSLNFNEAKSNIDLAFNMIYEQYYGQNLGAINLISDGNYNEGKSPIYTSEKFRYVPLNVLAVGDTIQKRDVLIKSIQANDLAFRGNQFPIEVSIEANKCKGEEIEIQISKGSKLLQSKQFLIEDNAVPLLKHTFIVESAELGFNEFNIEVSALENEINYENNKRSVYIEILDSRSKILLLANAPHPDLGCIRNSLTLDNNLEIIPKREIDKNKLNEYDLVIWHNPENNLNDAFLNELTQLQKPIWFILGPVNSSNTLKKLPININQAESDNTENVQADVNPNFSKFELSENAVSAINKFPPLYSKYGSLKFNNSPDILLFQKIGPVVKKDPLFFFSKEGNLKYAVTYGEGIWRWRLADFAQNGSHNVFDELMSKTVQYLMVKSNSNPLRINMPKEFNEGDEIIIGATFYNKSLEPIVTPEITFELIKNGAEMPYVFVPKEKSYVLNLGQLSAGAYQWKANASFEGESEAVSGSFLVRKSELEALDSKSNFQLLNQLSTTTNGKFVHLAANKELIDALETRNDLVSISKPETKYNPLLDKYWMLLLILLTLSAEWFLRKYNGGY